MMKQEFRKHIVEKFLPRREEELQFVVQVMMQPKTQKKFELYFETLKKKWGSGIGLGMGNHGKCIDSSTASD